MGANGKVWRFGRSGPPTVFAPSLLSQTGAFIDTTNLVPNPALLPYTVNSPLWSDGAEKTRWLAVPNNGAPYTSGEQISFVSTGEWVFPSGTVFVKHFELGTNDSNPALRRRLETRLLVRDTNDTIYGLTYRWRADNSDADLLSDSTNDTIVITSSSGTRTQNWFYPSPQDCITCHNPNAGHVLGVKTRQLNGDFLYPSSGVADNQLRTLNHLGLFTPALNENAISNYTKLVPVTQLNAGFEARMRSYLDANCAQCHRPGGVVGNWDARYDTPLAYQNIIDGAVFNTFGIPNAKEVAAADLSRSIMYLRMNTNGLAKMPPLARHVIDTNAVAALVDWILSYTPGPLAFPWQHLDIGPVLLPGNAASVTNTGGFTVGGSGTDIWDTADEFQYAYVNAGGNAEIIAHVTSITDLESGPWAKAGVMIRETLAPGSRNLFIALTPRNGVVFQWRTDTGAETSYQDMPHISVPYWLRLTRTNNVFRAFHSANGATWTQLGANLTVNLASNVTMGLAVSAVNSTNLNTATFASVLARSKGYEDSDGDGMPNSYELANSLDPNSAADAAQDADGDRMTNFQEFRAGTNPQNPNSVLRLTQVERQGDDLILGFLSATGKTYTVERATNLSPVLWHILTNFGPVSATNAVLTNSGGATGPGGIYRVRLVP
jgi:mono/diheme cytochrome c family protein